MTVPPGRPGRRHAAAGTSSRVRAVQLLAAVLTVLGLGLAGCGLAGGTDQAAAPAPVDPPALTAPPAPVAASAPLAKATPTRVRVPGIGVDSSLVPLGLNPDRTVEVPPLERSEQAGWFSKGTAPGSAGKAVILGHIDGGGKKGVFARLQEMTAGQRIVVTRADGRDAEFTVTAVRRYPKTDFPTGLVYGKAPDAELRLVSCGGTLDRAAHHYLDNVVVFATLTSSRAA